MTSRPPINVGIVGLTTNDKSSWAARAHLPYLLKSPHYRVQGVCNRTVESAQLAIETFHLPSSARAYSSIAELGADEEIDLVVVCTRVDTHYGIIKPLLERMEQEGEKKKDMFVEWPLGANLAQGRELARLAREVNGPIKTVIGLQARMNPAFSKIKEILSSGRIGNVLSVDVRATAPNVVVEMPANRAYFADRSSGGNLLTIRAMHVLDPAFFVHGEPVGPLRALLGNQVPYMLVKEEDGSTKRIEKDTPDHIAISGHMASASGPLFNFYMRGGKPFKDEPGLVWSVYGDEGEMQISCESSAIQMSFPLTVKIYDNKTDDVETVDVAGLDRGLCADLTPEARDVGRLYEAYALGKDYGDWELAVRRHELVEQIYREGGL
ncbi:NAD(P)-binding protein [Rhizodiscina lignyota]|uniref:NAD(P)-binding protein n=1 Tax=Rhizodiscina lignyota TaxID=1504668 RepID=A0A9P4IHU2_9PEZI|nr:NAD(P)-binding protein [Rhizodiscina lignyota]